MNSLRSMAITLLIILACGAQAQDNLQSPTERGADAISGASATAPSDSAAPTETTRLEVPRAATVSFTEDFDGDTPDWQAYVGTWQVRRDGDNSVFVQSATDSGYSAYPRVLWHRARYTDVDVTVRMKPISGKIDASGGIIFRAQDEQNYYVVRANALENNLRLYKVIDGDRKPPIASTKIAKPTLGQWHALRVVAVGPRIQVYLDDSLLIDHEDGTYAAGWVGLWTKADAVTEFDDVAVTGVPFSGS